MKPHRKHLIVVAFVAALMAPTTVMVLYAPSLYRTFCALTGLGGAVRRAPQPPAPVAHAAAKAKTVTVFFDANVAPGLDWQFRPEQRKVVARIGEPTQISYFARNNTNETVVTRATFNVSPYKAAPYFFKIECFCFTKERLGPGESAHMPVVFYVDEQMLKDSNLDDVHQITLSYTMFRQKGLTPEQVSNARDLSAGSKATVATLEKNQPAAFDNDAPRR